LAFRRRNGCNCDRKIVISRPLESDGAAVWHETPKISAVTMDIAAGRNLTVNPGRGKVFSGLTTPGWTGSRWAMQVFHREPPLSISAATGL
jgi:hypothetical protein